MYHLSKFSSLLSAGTSEPSTPPAYVSTAAANAGSSSFGVSFPATVNANDIAILIVWSNSTPSTPSGFTLIGTDTTPGGSEATLFWKRCTGSEDSTTVTVTVDFGYGQIVMFSGCVASGTPYEGFGSATDAGTTISAPNLTTTASARLGVGIYLRDDTEATTPPSGWTEHIDSTMVVNITLYLDSKSILTATTETGISRTGAGTEDWAAFSLALIPAA